MSDKITVKIKKLHPDAVIPQYAHKGDAGFDLVAVEEVIIEPGETKGIPLGLAFEIPEGYEMQIRPRSGISLKTKLRQSNCIGTIDAGYRGEVKGMFDNFFVAETVGERGETFDLDNDVVIEIPYGKYAHGTYLVRKGDRIAQGIIQKLPSVELVEVDELGDSERGEGGFGSSGVKA